VALKNYKFVDYATQGYLALVGLLILCFHNGTVRRWPDLFGAHVIGIVVIHLLIQWGSRKPTGVVNFLRHFYPVLIYASLFAETGSINRMFFGDYLDPKFAVFEESLFGCQPSVLFMAKMPYLPVSELFYASYFSYYLMIGGVGFALFFRNRRQFFHYVSVVSFLFYVCYVIYIILPVVGSRVFFLKPPEYTLPPSLQQMAGDTSYPEAVQQGPFYHLMLFIYRVFEAPGAAFPSSHVAVALCTVYFSFLYLRPIRYLHLVVAILLCLSTIYCRYHYVVDVFAGMITAATVVPLGNWLYFKFTGAAPAPEGG
jgi:membrane-associated phospholipid phosphatase